MKIQDYTFLKASGYSRFIRFQYCKTLRALE